MCFAVKETEKKKKIKKIHFEFSSHIHSDSWPNKISINLCYIFICFAIDFFRLRSCGLDVLSISSVSLSLGLLEVIMSSRNVLISCEELRIKFLFCGRFSYEKLLFFCDKT
jgi:hypothetical protein